MPTPKLYDLASKQNRCWNLTAWKTRLALNYKGIEYTTEFLEYPSVAPTLKGLGLEPNETGLSYSIPAMQFPDGTCVMDSRKIANKIEQVWPDRPNLHLDSPVLARVDQMEWELLKPLLPVVLPRIPRVVLNDEGISYFHETRSKYMGMPLDQLETEHGGDQAWDAAEKPWKELATMLKVEEGPYFLGQTVSYADFYVVSILESGRRLGDDIFERLLAIDSAFGALYHAAKPLLTSDN